MQSLIGALKELRQQIIVQLFLRWKAQNVFTRITQNEWSPNQIFFSFFPPKCPFVSQVAKKLLIWEEAEIADVV